MELSKELEKVFGVDFKTVLTEEVEKQDYMMQEDFADCTERANAMIDEATKRVRQVLALAIAKHRKDYHNEDRDAEISELSKGLDDELVSIGLMGWWWS